jgi:hypothetical protein
LTLERESEVWYYGSLRSSTKTPTFPLIHYKGYCTWVYKYSSSSHYIAFFPPTQTYLCETTPQPEHLFPFKTKEINDSKTTALSASLFTEGHLICLLEKTVSQLAEHKLEQYNQMRMNPRTNSVKQSTSFPIRALALPFYCTDLQSLHTPSLITAARSTHNSSFTVLNILTFTRWVVIIVQPAKQSIRFMADPAALVLMAVEIVPSTPQ